ncbi:MAG: PASTA domain-containing protein [Muribaculaceae bacterium]|nr:PASTA domain-containing protein [Muribaculaceae bacterium]
MKPNNPENIDNKPSGFGGRFPILFNVLIILAVALLGIWIVYISIALFTKHGETDRVPSVENMTYTQAVNLLHDAGFNVDIRDSLYKDDVKPGYVIEQFPKGNSIVKPGRKIFLYINAVHPKEVVIDDHHNSAEYALRGISYRQGLSRLEELGFKNIKVVSVLGDDDRIVKITANGRIVHNMERVPVNSKIVIEISDGRLSALRDSLYEVEQLNRAIEERAANPEYRDPYEYDPGYNPSREVPRESYPSNRNEQEEEELEFF